MGEGPGATQLKRVLVFGASGHTGRRIVRTLLQRGIVPRVFTRQPERIPLELRKQVEVFRGNLERVEDAREALRDVDAAIAMTHIKFAPRVIEAMQGSDVRRVVFTSSTRRFTKYPEETARQVIAGEQAVRESGLDWTIVRPSMIYGGYRDNNITHLVRVLRQFPVHPLVGGGKMLWQPVYTWDVARAVVTALERPQAIGREYTLAGPEPISYEQMVREILRQMKRRCLLVPIPIGLAKMVVGMYGKVSKRPRVRMDQILRLQEDKVFDYSDAARDLDFRPTSFAEGIKQKLAGRA